MKTRIDLAKAIAEAVDRKIDGVHYRSKAQIARAVGIQPPSLHSWITTGRVSGDRLKRVLYFFSDVTTPEHWGLTEWPSSIYKDPDSSVFVDMSINVKLPANIAKQVLDLINDYGIEK